MSAKHHKITWHELSKSQRGAIAVGGVAEIAMTAVAVVDLVQRAPEWVRGPKALWALAFTVQPFGPLAYFAFGRRGE